MSVVLGQRQREAGSAGADVSVPPVPVQYQMLPPALYIPSISQQGSRSRTQEGRVPYRPVHRRLLPPSSSSAGLYTTAPLPPSQLRKKIRRASSGQAVNGGASSSTTKTCASPDCSTIIPPASTSSRCMLCVRKAWMSRKSRGTVAKSAMASTEKRGTKEVRTLRGVLVEIGRPKWGGRGEDEEVPREKLKLFIPKAAVNKVEPQDIHISMLSPSEITICEEAENQVASPKAAESLLDSPAVMNRNERDDIYPSVDEGNMVVEEKNVTSVKVLAAEMNNSDQVEVGPAAPSTAVTCGSGYVEPVEMTTSSSLKTPITVDTHGPMDIGQSSSAEEDTIAGWDSDLTCISESNDEGESELDSSPLEVDESSLERLRQHTGLTIKIPARSSINISVCTITNCNQVLPSGYPWKSCVRCRARTREYQRKRQNLQGRHTKLDNELELLHTGVSINDLYSSFEPPTDLSGTETECAVVPGARLCSLKSCSHIIPPTSEYKWKMCSHCRKKTSERRRRKELKSRIENGLPVDAMNVSDSDMECLNPKLLPGRCVNQDCGMLVDDTASSSECRQCIARRLGLPGSNGMKRGHPRGARTSNLGATIASAQTARSPSEKGLNPLRSIKPPPSPPYPPYKCLTALLSDFSVRLDDFLEAQLLYFYYIQQNAKRSMGTIFVAMDYDVIGRRDEVEKGILNMKREIERCGTFSFSPDRRVSIINIGIITRFMCVHQSSTHIPTLAIPGQAHIPTFTKTLKGELEIAVLEDRSHSFLPGQRTVIRFRMIG
ncbi:hypothetical protein BDQ17DRAFT_1356570 [Cyathus striatus]|nr:hypothetical protein BDQ17DRAFT_1356570 [Cyathus striatus]